MRTVVVVGATVGALGTAWLAISTAHPPYVLATAAFAVLPVSYGVASMVRRSRGLPRMRLVSAAVVSLAVVAVASFDVLTACERQLGPGGRLAGCDLAAFDLRGLDLSDADLSGATLVRADLSGAALSDADLSGATLEGADLTDADLTGADLSEAVLSGAIVDGADLDGATLAAATLGALDLSGVALEGSSLAGVELSGGSLADAELAGADLTDASLARTDLSRADLAGAILAGADLSGATLRAAQVGEADLSGAILVGADLAGAELTAVLLQGADLSNARMADVQLDDADLGEAVLDDADLAGALARRASFAGASLTGVDLTGARLDGADLEGASLAAATLARTSLVEATGLQDPDIAASLGVEPGDLGAALASRGIRLEARDDVLASLAAACRGQSVAEAAPFPQGSLHQVVVLGDSGQAIDITDQVPGSWEPVAVRFAQLVACAEPEREETVEVCRYTVIETGAAGETVRRIRLHRDVTLVEARTGRVVERRSFQGGGPEFCAFEITPPFFESVLRGGSIGFGRLQPWLRGFVE